MYILLHEVLQFPSTSIQILQFPSTSIQILNCYMIVHYKYLLPMWVVMSL